MNPSVSICVVAHNEELFLPMLLEDIRQQTYPSNLIQVVLVDSVSIDSTLEIMRRFKNNADSFMSVTVVSNPKKIQAAGWNVAIASSTNEIIVRVDAHARIPSDFIEKNVMCLEHGEHISGGPRKCLAGEETPWQNLLLEVENSAFGSGINLCRRSTVKTYVKTMFHAAYRKEVFQKVGIFNENLLRTEDNELHYRMRKAGYRFCFDPNIVSYQYARNTLLRMIKQKYANGYWVGRTLKVCPGCISMFHLVPAAFVSGILATSFCIFVGVLWPSFIMWSAYCCFALMITLMTIYRKGFHFITLLMPLIFLIVHISYGLGTILGAISNSKGVTKDENR